jgi:hypothetical protein
MGRATPTTGADGNDEALPRTVAVLGTPAAAASEIT